MGIYDRGGPFPPYNTLDSTIPDISAIAAEWFINTLPLSSRLTQVESDGPNYKVVQDKPKPKSTALTTAIASNATTALVVADASVYDVDDMIEALGEYMLVTAVNTATNTLTVTRGYADTTALAAIAQGTPVYIVGNSRTGSAVDIEAMTLGQNSFLQWNQTFQHAYSIGGATASNRRYVSEHGLPLQRDIWNATQRTETDIEDAMAYGRRVAITGPGSKPAMAGIRQQCVTNRVTTPTNGSAYKSSDFIRDTFQRIADSGGKPTHCLVSTDFLSGFAAWKTPAIRFADAGVTEFNVAIDTFTVSFMPGVLFIPAPRFRPGTAFMFNEAEVRKRVKRSTFDKPRGSRGDAYEGDIISECSVEVLNEQHQAWVEGITVFAAS